MNTPDDLRYTASHEWVRTEADGTLTVGITDHAQEALGDVVFLELPDAGRSVEAGEAIAVIESVKAASDIFAPVSGEVVEANAALADSPGDVNAEPMGKGWFFKIRMTDKAQLEGLMDEAAYDAFVKNLG